MFCGHATSAAPNQAGHHSTVADLMYLPRQHAPSVSGIQQHGGPDGYRCRCRDHGGTARDKD
jgi:hypothetical protein